MPEGFTFAERVAGFRKAIKKLERMRRKYSLRNDTESVTKIDELIAYWQDQIARIG